MARSTRSILAALLFLAPAGAAEDKALFEKEIQPILKANCLKCHGEGKVRGGLSLMSRAGLLKGGDTGPAFSKDKPEDSLLLQAINHSDNLKMPPKGKLSLKEIEALTRWLKVGAPWPESGAAVVETERKERQITDEDRNYWAYRPMKRPITPAVKNKDWIRNPIDAFILSRLEEKGLSPAAPADKVALIRRAYYDLTGLPPKPEEIDAFGKDRSAEAYEKMIDRLLESKHYGEKWGRFWLDLVRYAETNGYERDSAKPFAWRYRDYVIKSFNDDKPYDRFIKEQLAGDEMPGDDADAVIATGYYRLGLWDDEPADPLLARFDELDDIVTITSQVFLGMTMNCARCHDHKIDPIPQTDYYRMVAFFRDIPRFSLSNDPRSRTSLTDVTPSEVRKTYEAELKKREIRLAELTTAMTKIEDKAIKMMPTEDQRASEGADRPKVLLKLKDFLMPEQSEQYAKLKRERDELAKVRQPQRIQALSVTRCEIHPPPTFVLGRGNPRAEKKRVEPGFPAVLGLPDPTVPAPAKGAKSSGRRTILANWIASKDNALTARTMANRLWQQHFGRGIVPTPSDFGKFGEKPTHPELLDWLASELVSGEPGTKVPGPAAPWTLKRMHKLLMTSNAYRMSSKANAESLRLDPANTSFWRFNMRRLTAEEVRDSMLAASGLLNPKMGGPSIYPVIPREVLAGQSVPGAGWGRSSPEEAARRSVYAHVKRSLQVPILIQYDQADTDGSCPVRYTTTVPTQALGMLNGAFANEQAAAFAQRLWRESPGGLEQQVRLALRLTTGRVPADAELRKDLDFIDELRTKHKLSADDALKQYCLLALNANEFVYLD
jgi:hypothetical protein